MHKLNVKPKFVSFILQIEEV